MRQRRLARPQRHYALRAQIPPVAKFGHACEIVVIIVTGRAYKPFLLGVSRCKVFAQAYRFCPRTGCHARVAHAPFVHLVRAAIARYQCAVATVTAHARSMLWPCEIRLASRHHVCKATMRRPRNIAVPRALTTAACCSCTGMCGAVHVAAGFAAARRCRRRWQQQTAVNNVADTRRASPRAVGH